MNNESTYSSSKEKLAALLQKKQQDILNKEKECLLKIDDFKKSVSSKIPLSLTQKRFFLIDQLSTSTLLNHIPFVFKIKGFINHKEMQSILREIVQNFEILRTTFHDENGLLFQKIHSNIDLPFEFYKKDAFILESEVKSFIRDFSLNSLPLFRVRLISISENESYMLLDFHHIIADARSFSILINTIIEGLQTKVIKQPLFQYQQYVFLEQKLIESSYAKIAHQFWSKELSNAPALVKFLTIKSQSLNPNLSPADSYSFTLDDEMKQKLKKASASLQGTLYMLLLSCFACILRKKSSSNKFLIGTSLLGRSIQGTQDIFGPFINNVPIKCDFNSIDTFGSFFKKIKDFCIKAFEYQSYPFLHFQELEQKVDYNVFFELHHKKIESIFLNQAEFEFIDYRPPLSKFDLCLEVFETEQGLLFEFEYSKSVFSFQGIKELADDLIKMMKSALENHDVKITPNFHETQSSPSSLLPHLQPLLEKNIMEVVEEIAQKYPYKIAVLDNTSSLSYMMLVNLVHRLSINFESIHIHPEKPIIILMDRSIEFLITMLACFKTGVPYIPVDPSQPIERLKTLLLEANAQSIFYDSSNEQIALLLQSILPVHKIQPLLTLPRESSLKYLKSSPQHIAYIIFTSGSTGKPKGVMVPHLGMMNHLAAKIQELEIKSSDVIAQTAIQTFDVSVWQFLIALVAGATVSIFRNQTAWDPPELLHKIESDHITIFETVPAHMKIILDYLEGDRKQKTLGNLKWLVLNGEILTPDICNRFFKLFPQIPIINAYGPTECSDDTCHKKVFSISHEVTNSIPIGKVIPNTRAYLLDENLSQVSFGEQGELYFSGICLARGYYNKPILTAQTFIPSENGERKYRTGDHARYLPSQDIEYIGRIDNEVKIRGQRISPHEVEAVLKTNPLIKDCIVIPFKNDFGEWALLCYYLLKNQSLLNNETTQALRSFLKDHLTDAMVPRQLVSISSIPLLPNGKVNKKALPDPKNYFSLEIIEKDMMSQTEEIIAEIWKQALSIPSIKKRDHFFDIGGHSLLATQVVNLLSIKLKKSVPLKILFSNPLLVDFAKEVDKILKTTATSAYLELPSLKPDILNRYKPFPTTEVQQAYLFGRKSLYELGNVSVHVYAEYEKDYIDLDRLEKSWNIIIKRHDALRTIFPDPMIQIILSETDWYKIEFLNFTQINLSEQNKKLEEIRSNLSHEVFESDKWPLFKIQVIKLPHKYRIYLSFDALLIDGWSTDILFDEWFKLYSNPNINLDLIEISIRDYVLSLIEIKKTNLYKKDREYWQNKLSNFPHAPKLPILKKPQEIKKPAFARCTKRIPKAKWEMLMSFLKKNGFSPTGFLAALFGEVLAKFSGDYHFALNLTLFDRLPLHPQINSVTGDFTSLFLLEIDSRDQSISLFERLKKTQETLWEALEHKLYSGISFLRDLSQHHQAVVSFPVVLTAVLGIQDNQSQEIQNFFGSEVFSITQTPQVWLDYKAYEIEGGLVVEWDYVKDLFPENFIQNVHLAYCDLLTELSHDLHRSQQIFSLELPPLQKESRIQYNSTRWDYKATTLFEAFSLAAKKYPLNVAIITDEKELSYNELYHFSNFLGRSLRNKQVTNSPLIGILLEKGWQQVLAVFGILAAGKAYLPIDPSLPQERILTILKDAKISIIITEKSWVERLKDLKSCDILDINQIDFSSSFSTSYEPQNLSESSLAYTIFTSGSTGKPKGVMINNSAVMNTIQDINERLNLDTTDRSFCLSNLSFDLSVYDIFGPLVKGGAIVIPDSKEIKNPAYWVDQLTKHKVSVWNTVPMYMQMLIEHLGNSLQAPNSFKLDKVLLSGDWIPLELPEKVFNICHPNYFFSLGGATEASIWSIIHPIRKNLEYTRSIPYGKPLRNQSCYILDDCGFDQPDWVTGEFCIGGAGLADGYFNDLDKTKQSFINHPKYGRLYKTGDLARFLPQQEIEIIGRKDSQIKIKGHRIELGDILTTLKNHPDIENALIVPQKTGKEVKSLIAYFIPFIPKVEEEEGILFDRQERFKFKANQTREPKQNLESIPKSFYFFDPKEKLDVFFKRKSYRNFSTRQLTVSELKNWLTGSHFHFDKKVSSIIQKLEILSCIPSKNSTFPKYYYPSAGNTYATTLFVKIDENCIEGFQEGTYEYEPQYHNLKMSEIDFKYSFSKGLNLILASKLKKIQPLYGSASKSFIYLEYGYIIGALESVHLLDLKVNYNVHALDKTNLLSYDFSFPLLIEEKSKNSDSEQVKSKKIDVVVYIKESFFQDLEPGWYEWTESELINLKNESIFSLSLAADINYFLLNNASAICFFLSNYLPEEKDYIEVGRISQKLCSYQKGAPLIGACAIGMFDSKGDKILKEIFPAKHFIQAIAIGPIDNEHLIEKNESNISNDQFYSILDRYLKNHLPYYMVPSQYVALDKFPLSPNGKLDLKALPLPNDQMIVKKDLAKTEMEKSLAKIWGEKLLINEKTIGIHDNFFEIGGNSLIAIQIHNELIKIYPNIVQIDHLFQYPSISQLSQFLENSSSPSIRSNNLDKKIQQQKNRIKFNKTKHKKN